MFKIIKDGAQIGMTEAPNYIKLAPNGCYNLCPELQAQGIVFAGTVYQLIGREEMEGELAAVFLEETDAGDEITRAVGVNGIMFVTLTEAGAIDDTTASEHADLFSPWAYPVSYTKGQIRRYTDGKLYKCLQAHTSQSDWTPDTAASLWVSISDRLRSGRRGPSPRSHDAYDLGAKVSHKGKHWTSDVAANVWEPGVYGWTEVES